MEPDSLITTGRGRVLVVLKEDCPCVPMGSSFLHRTKYTSPLVFLSSIYIISSIICVNQKYIFYRKAMGGEHFTLPLPGSLMGLMGVVFHFFALSAATPAMPKNETHLSWGLCCKNASGMVNSAVFKNSRKKTGIYEHYPPTQMVLCTLIPLP